MNGPATCAGRRSAAAKYKSAPSGEELFYELIDSYFYSRPSEGGIPILVWTYLFSLKHAIMIETGSFMA